MARNGAKEIIADMGEDGPGTALVATWVVCANAVSTVKSSVNYFSVFNWDHSQLVFVQNSKFYFQQLPVLIKTIFQLIRKTEKILSELIL